MTLRTICGIGILATLLVAAGQEAKKASTNDAVDMENLKALGSGWAMYAGDADDRSLIAGWPCFDPATRLPAECHDYYYGGKMVRIGEDLSEASRTSTYWTYILLPYIRQLSANPNNSTAFWPNGKNRHWFDAPDAKGQNVGGQNSYGYNATYLSPMLDRVGVPTSPTMIEAVPRPSQTTVFCDATFHLVGPDVLNESRVRKQAHFEDVWNGAEAAFADNQGQFRSDYWKNIGGSDWSYGYGIRAKGSSKLDPSLAMRRIGGLNSSGMVYEVAVDTHVFQLTPVEAVGNICYWSTDLEGAHPHCRD